MTIVGRRGGVTERLVAEAGLALVLLRISGVDISRPITLARFASQLPVATRAARRLIRRLGVEIVIGGAGYVSVPVVLAARLDHVPVVLLEQNALPGRATRLLARWADAVAVAFAETTRHLAGVRVVHTGNPIRREVLDVARRPLGDSCRKLLVMGGSQGARRINQAVTGCVAELLHSHPELAITHQSGARDADMVTGTAASLPIELRARYTVRPFFDDVGERINAADLVLMRAGGSSLAECSALARPMILVPYPHAGGHQRLNAEPYVADGAARLVHDQECTSERVRQEVLAILDDPPSWRAMAAASEGLSRRDASAQVVALMRQVVASQGRISE